MTDITLGLQGNTAHSFVHWAGGKKQLLPEIRVIYTASRRERRWSRYVEPFVGGGAVLFDTFSSCPETTAVICDKNADLMAVYEAVRDDPEAIIDCLAVLSQEYHEASDVERTDLYTRTRERFNEMRLQQTERRRNPAEFAAVFLFLNRTCFNGLYRVNSRNEFNVSMGTYKPVVYDAGNLRAASVLLKNRTALCQGDYSCTEHEIGADTFVYLDPPYRPISQTANFTSYTRDGFDDAEQYRLAEFVRRIDRKGATFVLTNSDPKNKNLNDNFFDELYAAYKIRRVSSRRAINCDPTGRGKLHDLLITNYRG